MADLDKNKDSEFSANAPGGGTDVWLALTVER